MLNFRFVEHAELIGRYILLLLARLTEARSLHIQENLIHVIELCSEFIILSLEHTDLML